MQTKHRVLPPEILMEEYRELLKNESIEALPLVISGKAAVKGYAIIKCELPQKLTLV